jgi:hypothetical protein
MTNDHDNQTEAPAPRVPEELRYVPKMCPPDEAGEIQMLGEGGMPTGRTEFSKWHNEYVRQQIELADRKAIWLFAILTALLIYFAKNYSPSYADHLFIIKVFLFLPFIFTTVSVISAGSVIAPRLSSSNDYVIFFSNIANYNNSQEYISKIESYTSEELIEKILSHSYDLSIICVKKYRRILISFYTGVLGAISGVVVGLFFPQYSLI